MNNSSREILSSRQKVLHFSYSWLEETYLTCKSALTFTWAFRGLALLVLFLWLIASDSNYSIQVLPMLLQLPLPFRLPSNTVSTTTKTRFRADIDEGSKCSNIWVGNRKVRWSRFTVFTTIVTSKELVSKSGFEGHSHWLQLVQFRHMYFILQLAFRSE